MEKARLDVGGSWMGLSWGVAWKGKGRRKNMFLGRAGDIRSLFQRHSPGGATVCVMLLGGSG